MIGPSGSGMSGVREPVLKPLGTAALLLLVAAAPAEPKGFLEFSKKPAFGPSTTTDIGTLFVDDQTGNYWLKQTIKNTDSTAVEWTDTIRCPAAKTAITDVVKVTPPQVWIPDVDVRPDGTVRVAADGIAYEIKADAHYDGAVGSQISFTSNVGAPLANWVEDTLGKLSSCWSKQRPGGRMF